GGRPAFMIRLLLAATLSASYGLYGPPYELCEARAFPGTEDYVYSEKYQVRYWNRAQPGNISGLITAVNRIRREHPALQHTSNIAFHPSSNDHILFFSKEWSGDLLFIIINLDPHRAQEGWMDVPAPQFGLPASFLVRDLLADKTFEWKNSRNFVRLDPSSMPAHLLKVSRA